MLLNTTAYIGHAVRENPEDDREKNEEFPRVAQVFWIPLNECPANFHHVQHSDDIDEARVFEQRDELTDDRGNNVANRLGKFNNQCRLPSWQTKSSCRLNLSRDNACNPPLIFSAMYAELKRVIITAARNTEF